MPLSKEKILYYNFKVKFLHHKSVYTEIEIEDEADLRDLARLILKSVKFDFDHLCGFYSNIKNKYSSEEKYEMFCDPEAPPEMMEPDEDSKPMYDTLVKDVFESKKKMLFFFDYGDNWDFEVTCTKILDKKQTRAGVVKREGKPPLQYPSSKKSWDYWWQFH